MYSSTPSDDPLARVIKRDVARIARNSAILYLVNMAAVLAGIGVFSYLFGATGSNDPILYLQLVVVTVYAVVAFLWSRHAQGKWLGLHFYIVGLLGLAMGALFYAWGGLQLLSAGYWLRQYYKNGTARSNRDGGEVVLYGGESLVNLKTSRPIRIGFDYPRKWNIIGLAVLVLGFVLQETGTLLPSVGFFSLVRNGWLLFIDGTAFTGSWFSQKMYLGGQVRLPPGTEYRQNQKGTTP